MGETSTTDGQTVTNLWSESLKWAQGIGSSVIGGWASSTYQQPFELEKLKIQALGDKGYYTEGQASAPQKAAGLSPLVLIGGLVVLVLLLNKA